MIVAGTSCHPRPLQPAEPGHDRVKSVVDAEPEPLVVSPDVVAELDHLVAARLGTDAEVAVLDELAGGGYDLAPFDADDLRVATGIVRRDADLDVGVADASIVVLAGRRRTRTVLTLDHRHVNARRPLAGGRFRLVP